MGNLEELGWASGLYDSTAGSLYCWAPRNWAGKSESTVLMKGRRAWSLFQSPRGPTPQTRGKATRGVATMGILTATSPLRWSQRGYARVECTAPFFGLSSFEEGKRLPRDIGNPSVGISKCLPGKGRGDWASLGLSDRASLGRVATLMWEGPSLDNLAPRDTAPSPEP